MPAAQPVLALALAIPQCQHAPIRRACGEPAPLGTEGDLREPGTLDALPAGDYRATREELRGDALLKLGRDADARKAFADALSALPQEASPGLRQLLQMKRDDLKDATAPVATAQPAQPGAAHNATPTGKQGT